MKDNLPSNDLINFLSNLTTKPGVYRMQNDKGEVIYVGKANNLKKRVSSYFTKQNKSVKTQSLVSQIVSIEVSVTRSETEAYLLESSLIKSLRPKYNILMRDDKSYPFLHVTNTNDFPRLEIMRYKKKPKKGEFYGPYPSINAVRETLNIIQSIFKIRNCSDIFFNNRTRPCLQYQIKRCSAPCTSYINKDDYKKSVDDMRQFLQGKCQQIINDLALRIDSAVSRLAFEEAAILRDQIKSLRLVQEQQGVVRISGDADIITIEAKEGFACIFYVTVRDGEVLESKSFFPSVPEVSLNESQWLQVFEAFVAYYYVDTPLRIPALIITDDLGADLSHLQKMLTDLRGKTCKFDTRPRGVKARWLDFARNNIQLAISGKESTSTLMKIKYQALCNAINIAFPIKRMECFDISHTQGAETVASCVVFDKNGPCKREYRKFNISNITPGDDYAAMEQVLTRRFKRLNITKNLPDLIIVDGGKGQVEVARRVLITLEIVGVNLIGIAKGPGRKAGLERIILSDENAEIILSENSQALHLLQQIRDEAHRFAITNHRKKREKRSIDSSLESIAGIGAKRRRALLVRFGGIRELAKAPIDEIAKVHGISEELAERIYQYFHVEDG